MKNFRFYFYVTISVIIFFILLSVVATPLVVKNQTTQFLDHQIEATRQNAKTLASLCGAFFEEENGKNRVLIGVQKGIGNSFEQPIFNSVIDWSGQILAHPDITLLDTAINEDKALTSRIDNVVTGEKLYDYVVDNLSKDDGSTSRPSNIIHLELVPQSDLIIATHLNISVIETIMNEYAYQTYMIFFITGLLALVCLLMTTRVLSSYYDAQIAIKSTKIEDSVVNLNKLNTSLEKYQRNLQELKSNPVETTQVNKPSDSVKQRLLTYVRNELVPIAIEEIAYIYVENKITYLVCRDGKRSTSNDSLDQIYSSLDPRAFFRANRQIIVSIQAISKITKYGNNALKIQTNPLSEVDIVIGKNKAAQFRQWLDL